jgi:hypothetical protein
MKMTLLGYCYSLQVKNLGILLDPTEEVQSLVQGAQPAPETKKCFRFRIRNDG